MKSMIFASRNLKELIRDPLSWIFCLGFPLVLLVVMTLINNSIPKEANMRLFHIQNLAPGISVFGFTFIMLFACILLANDRQEAFLMRLFASPMKPADYITGYILPLLVLSLGQALIVGGSALLTGLIQKTDLNMLYILVSIVISIPSMLLMIGFGLLFGTIFSKNAAPGLCSIVITFSGLLGGIWMDIESMGGTLSKICNALPFYHAVKAARFAYAGTFAESFTQAGVVMIWTVPVVVLSILVFQKKMRQ